MGESTDRWRVFAVWEKGVRGGQIFPDIIYLSEPSHGCQMSQLSYCTRRLQNNPTPPDFCTNGSKLRG